VVAAMPPARRNVLGALQYPGAQPSRIHQMANYPT
jgi:hypothetical protein